MFLGILYGTLCTRLGVWPSAVGSALLFALPHGYAAAGLLSVFASWPDLGHRLRAHAKPLAGMLAHRANNLMSTALARRPPAGLGKCSTPGLIPTAVGLHRGPARSPTAVGVQVGPHPLAAVAWHSGPHPSCSRSAGRARPPVRVGARWRKRSGVIGRSRTGCRWRGRPRWRWPRRCRRCRSRRSPWRPSG